jgi:hypothetical protein
MWKITVIAFFLSTSFIAFSQSNTNDKQSLHFYYPDGTKYHGSAKTMGELNFELEKEGRVYYHLFEYKDEFTIVGFKLFTNIPLYIETTTPEIIDSAIKNFQISDYFKYFIDINLNNSIEQKNLKSSYFNETLGKPNSIKDSIYDNQPVQLWNYRNIGLTTVFADSLLIAYKQELDQDFTDKKTLHDLDLSLQLKDNNYYWLSESYERFLKDTNSTDFFAAQWSSSFKVLYSQGSYTYIKFDQLSTVSNAPLGESYITKRFGDDTITTIEVNTEDLYTLKTSDFSIRYYSKIGEKVQSDYLVKGQLLNKNKEPIRNQKLTLIIDENYNSKDSIFLKTSPNGGFSYRGNTKLNFLCTMGIKNRKEYFKKHENIIFTLCVGDRKYSKTIKQKALSDSQPIVFDIITN